MSLFTVSLDLPCILAFPRIVGQNFEKQNRFVLLSKFTGILQKYNTVVKIQIHIDEDLQVVNTSVESSKGCLLYSFTFLLCQSIKEGSEVEAVCW